MQKSVLVFFLLSFGGFWTTNPRVHWKLWLCGELLRFVTFVEDAVGLLGKSRGEGKDLAFRFEILALGGLGQEVGIGEGVIQGVVEYDVVK